MNFIKHIERIEKIDKLIQENKTGGPDEFAGQMGISRRQLYNYLDELRSFGIDIQYSRLNHSFHYSNNKRLRINLNFEVIDQYQSREINGGYKINSMFLDEDIDC
jgi:predicted DNA-binding transcriptional regulator YafY